MVCNLTFWRNCCNIFPMMMSLAFLVTPNQVTSQCRSGNCPMSSSLSHSTQPSRGQVETTCCLSTSQFIRSDSFTVGRPFSFDAILRPSKFPGIFQPRKILLFRGDFIGSNVSCEPLIPYSSHSIETFCGTFSRTV